MLLPDPNISDKSLEFLFRPSTVGELLIRLVGIESFEKMLSDFLNNMSPGAMPHRFRDAPANEARCVILREKIYQEEKRRRAS